MMNTHRNENLQSSIKFAFALSLIYAVVSIAFSVFELEMFKTFEKRALEKQWHVLSSQYHDKYGEKISPDVAMELLSYEHYEYCVLFLIMCGTSVQVILPIILDRVSVIRKVFVVSWIWYMTSTFNTVISLGYIIFDMITYGLKPATISVSGGEVILAILMACCFVSLRKYAISLNPVAPEEISDSSDEINSVSTEVPFSQLALPTYEQAVSDFPKPPDGATDCENRGKPPNYEDIATLTFEVTGNASDHAPPQYSQEEITENSSHNIIRLVDSLENWNYLEVGDPPAYVDSEIQNDFIPKLLE